MTKEKSTHSGMCQACLRIQKLKPNTNKLVLHGYERPGTGSINGSCFGVDELPYELSCELMVSINDNERRTIAQLQAHLQRWQTADVVHVATLTNIGYLRHSSSRRRYLTRSESDIALDPITHMRGIDRAVEKMVADGEVKVSTVNAEEARTWKLYEREIDALHGAIKYAERSVRARDRMIADWQLRPVRPVEDINKQVVVGTWAKGFGLFGLGKKTPIRVPERLTLRSADEGEARILAERHGLVLVATLSDDNK